MAQKALVLPVGTANYVAVFKPRPPPNAKEGDENNYSITVTYDKKDGMRVLQPLMEAAIAVANQKWPGKGKEVIQAMKYPIIADGDLRTSPSSGDPMFPGKLFVVAKRKERFGAPGVRDIHRKRIGPAIYDGDGKVVAEDSTARMYAGVQVRVEVNLFPFAHPLGGRGIGVGLNNILIVADGQRLDGRRDAEEAFEDYFEEEEPAAGDENPDSML